MKHDHKEHHDHGGHDMHNHHHQDKHDHKQNHSSGYGGHESHSHHDHHAMMIADFRKRFWVSLIITLPVLALAPMIQTWLGIRDALSFAGDSWAMLALSSILFFYGGWPFLSGLFSELKKRNPGMMTLIGLAIGIAFLYSALVTFGLKGHTFFWELATLIDVMLLGHWIEMRSVMGASKALEELTKLMPSTTTKVNEDGSTEEVSIKDLRKGDTVLVRPGDKLPADGEVSDGQSSVNESMITGESVPVSKKAGAEVIGGSVNGEGSLKIVVRGTGEESFLSQMVKLVQEAQASKSKTQNLADRAARWLTAIALSAGTITFAAWMIFSDNGLTFAMARAVTVMVIACPHALGLAIPLVVAVSTAQSAKNGLLIRNRSAFERARNLQAIVFDKTGTLTLGKFGVTDTIVLDDNYEKEEVLRLAAGVELESEHPLARGIVEGVKSVPKVKNFSSIPGTGAEGEVDGKQVKVVRPSYLEEERIHADGLEQTKSLAEDGKTVVVVLVNDKPVGAVALADIIREESKEAVQKLQEMDVRTIMLTGDNERVARYVAKVIGIDDVFAEVRPDEKADKVKEVQSGGTVTAMVGDGVNDAPALATADVGIAIGAGTDVAAETADVILVRDDPRDVAAAVRFSRATYNKMIQNLWWATGYNAIAIPLAAGVLFWLGIILNPAVGAALMSVSTVVVAINARLLKVERG